MIETTCTAAVTISLAKSEALQGKTLAKFEKEGVQVKQVNAQPAQGLPGRDQEGDGGKGRRQRAVQEGL